MAQATKFQDSTAVTARAAEVAGASFVNGCNQAASCAPGIGINVAGGAQSGNPNNWTLLDQFTVARNPQLSQVIGGKGLTAKTDWPGSGGISGNGTGHNEYIFCANPSSTGDGTVTVTGSARLQTLNAGWVSV